MNVLTAFTRGLRSQLRPGLLMLTLGPFVLGLILGAALLWMTWGWLTGWVKQLLGTDIVWLQSIFEWLSGMGWSAIDWVAGALALGLYVVLALAFALTVVATLAMPVVVSSLARRDYPDVQALKGGSFIGGAWNALWVTVVMVLGWLLCLPTYLFPPFALLIPWLWWTFAFYRILSYDALAEHATRAERKVLMRKHRWEWIVLSGALAALNWVPFAWLALPVFSGIVFTHFGLQALRSLRAEATV